MNFYQADTIYGAMYANHVFMDMEWYAETPEPEKSEKMAKEIEDCLHWFQVDSYPQDMIDECRKNNDFKIRKTMAFVLGAMAEFDRMTWTPERYDTVMIQDGIPQQIVLKARIMYDKDQQELLEEIRKMKSIEPLPPYCMAAYDRMMDHLKKTGEMDEKLWNELERRVGEWKDSQKGKSKKKKPKTPENVIDYEQSHVLVNVGGDEPADIIQFPGRREDD